MGMKRIFFRFSVLKAPKKLLVEQAFKKKDGLFYKNRQLSELE